MTRTLRGSLLIASMLIVAWATTSEACHRRRAHATATNCYAGYTYGGPTGYYGAGGGYGMAGYPGGYGYGRPGYGLGGIGGPLSGLGVRPGLGFGAPGMGGGGIGGPASGLGVRPGLGFGGLGRGADRPQVLRSPCGGAPAWTYGLTRGGVGGGQLIGAAAGYRAAGGR